MEILKKQFAKQLGANIAKFRQQKQLTQEQLAEILGVTNEAVSRMERGVAMPSLMRLIEIANVYQCTINELFADISITNKEQENYIGHLLQTLSEKDRLFIIKIIEQFVQHSQ